MLNWQVTYMERRVPPTRAITLQESKSIRYERAQNIKVGDYRKLYRMIGENWLWWERLTLTDSVLNKIILNECTKINLLKIDKEIAGFTELDTTLSRTPAIRYFGLIPKFIGLHLGSFMMDSLLNQAWNKNVKKITLDTCNLDHPTAKNFYKHHGFKQTHTEIKKAIDPRTIGILPVTAAPHIPIN